MRVLFGFPGWGWKMYGLASFRSGNMWFVGFTRQLQCGGGADALQECNELRDQGPAP